MSEAILIPDDRLAALPPHIAASWTRCATVYRLDPNQRVSPELLCGAELRQACSRMGSLMKIAEPELDRLHGIVSTLDYTVLMADAQGVILTSRGNHPLEKGHRRWHLCPGARWSEREAGTNGVGTSLVEGKPVTVHMEQHWRLGLRYLACSAVPFYGPDGQLTGVLDTSSTRPDPGGRIAFMMEAVLIDAARRIERRSFLEAFRDQTVVLLGESNEVSLPMVALDESRVVVGATFAARPMLGLNGNSNSSICFDLGTRGRGVPDFHEAERAVIEGALAMSGGKIAPAARLLGISRSTLHRKIRAMQENTGSVQA
ncbi:helix-turn-helix domain-containing protein [Acetobacter oeni]|uniref:Fis family transcriptional regulator n=1 Tax=Acetobacter oeni TaxID=304077 RepID=A0A511XK26_9PROT|nr:helix-turn-helix domain-containing protein [Acetobacter oeni]MBB3883124.1 transcriptional regulator of acetoin/glycerol metabolism [Acetobacter oeni]NHO19236.1 GAF domain-containing protein [Acetobacter oeni]GBR07040.1 transcriptional regulator [Acetobacter oeni LMG 21952]GEN63305.1 Fis family transcriptional regulator [Acetobacter oeni]